METEGVANKAGRERVAAAARTRSLARLVRPRTGRMDKKTEGTERERSLGRRTRSTEETGRICTRTLSMTLQETGAGAWAYVSAGAAGRNGAGPYRSPRLPRATAAAAPLADLFSACACARRTDRARPPRVLLPRKLSLSPPPSPLQNSSVPQAGSRSTSSLIPTFLPPLPLPSLLL